MTITITAFERSPDGGQGLARDTRVRWALEEVGHPYEVRLVSFRALKEPAHLALHPFGQIPTFEEDDVVLFETGAIILHLAERHAGLLPIEPAPRARALSLVFAALNTVEPPILELANARLLESCESWSEARLPLVEDRTRRVTELAHWCGASVEGEIGVLGSLETGGGEQEDGHGFEGTLGHDKLLTDPDEAARFVADTHVDALAVAVGTSHGAYKFSREPDGDVLAMDVIEAIHQRLPNTHLVMHGSSSVPEDLQEIVTRYGGELKPTWGVPVEEIQRGIRHGVRKINIDTDCRLAMTGAIRKVFAERPQEFDPRKYLGPAMEAVTKLAVQRFEEFGTAGKAAGIKPISLADMAKRYAKGSLRAA